MMARTLISLAAGGRASLLLLALLLAACGDGRDCVDGSGTIVTETRQVAPFTELELAGSISMIISPGDSISVTVVGDDNLVANVDTDVHDGRLVAGYDGCFDTDSMIVVHVALPTLRSVQLSGSGNISSQGTLRATSLLVRNNGSGSIDLDVAANTVRTTATGSGEVVLAGTSAVHEAILTGSGTLQTAELATERTIVTSNGSGDMFVDVSRALRANLNGSGDLHYAGSPTSLTLNTSGSGRGIKVSAGSPTTPR